MKFQQTTHSLSTESWKIHLQNKAKAESPEKPSRGASSEMSKKITHGRKMATTPGEISDNVW